ncbi:MAG: glycolate oxidase subunit GlcF [Rhodospirillaceae bacterium]|nr:glycolate oxidase subunit GlcF [Rhodospirillaceae bacterium]
MQTNFTLAQLADQAVAESEKILRTCVHCGFCLATCPTYTLLGDELDSPRGRIYQIKDMLENGRAAPDTVVTHIDRCLSCLACMTTCPSGVHYQHLVDHARTHIEHTYTRPFADRAMRWMLAHVIPHPTVFRFALLGAMLGRWTAPILPPRMKAMLALAPKRMASPSWVDRPQVIPAEGPRRQRVALLTGCAQQVLDPQINEATVRLLTRHGVEVVVAKGAGCCGAVTHHMGKEEAALVATRANVAAWSREMAEFGGPGLDAIVINTSGCGTSVKDYGFMLRGEPAWAERAAVVSAKTKDISEFLIGMELLPRVVATGHRITYHSACSMQHGQKITTEPKTLLKRAGFKVKDVPEGHLCCGSAGTYNLLQPAIATKLRNRKVANIERTRPQFIVTGNIGCMSQIATGTDLPIVHTVQVLDWVTGGPLPVPLQGRVEEQPAAAAAEPPATAVAAE